MNKPSRELMPKQFSLYFHIPFCQQKCHYCHFYSLPIQDDFTSRFISSLCQEWEEVAWHFKEKELVSIYLGGGTPSIIGPDNLRYLFKQIKEKIELKDSVELTLETNPEGFKLEFFQDFFKLGINRISMGVQAFQDHHLKQLGRRHSAKVALNAISNLKNIGFKNISIDLMYDLPSQTLEEWEESLSIASHLPITHISLYNLTIEPKTFFAKHKKQIKQPLPHISLKMYQLARKVLKKAGFNQYEISAFAKPGYESKHNLGYWLGRPFWGLGPSAFSYWQGERFRNISSLDAYNRLLSQGKSPINFREKLSPLKTQREALVLNLRVTSGVSLATLQEKYGPLAPELREELTKLQDQKLLKLSSQKITLTSRGILFYDTVAASLV